MYKNCYIVCGFRKFIKVCRYSFTNYKYHYTCFNCRKSFKQTTGRDLLQQNGLLYQYDKLLDKYAKSGHKDKEIKKLIEELENKYFVREIKCPECGNIMCNLGLDFKPPPKNKIKEWRIISKLYRLGHSFYSCGCDGIGFIPKSNFEYKQYLNDMKKEYRKKGNLKYTAKYDDIEYKKYWEAKIKLIDEELRKIDI